MSVPTPSAIREARAKAGLTQAAAAETVGVSWRTWARWEAGGAPMKGAAWELFLIKTAQSPE